MSDMRLSVGEPIESSAALCPPCWGAGVDSEMRPAGDGRMACDRCGKVWPPDDAADGES